MIFPVKDMVFEGLTVKAPNQPKVSVLVPIYGVEKYIERCAVSLLEQTYRHVEYIFVDDKTPDASIAILEEVIARYPDRSEQVRVLHHEVNRGISATRNTAFDAATGDYLYQVDSDDYLATDALEKLVSEASSKQLDILLLDIFELRENETVRYDTPYTDKVGYVKGLIQHTQRCAHWNKFYRADFFRRSQVRCVEGIRLADDYAVTPRLLHQAERIGVMHEPLYYYETRNQGSYVHNLNRSAIESQFAADKVLKDYFEAVADKALYADVVQVLMPRSVCSLLKHSDIASWGDIRDVYRDYIQQSGAGMTFLNRFIFYLFQQRYYQLLRAFLIIYHLVA